MKYKILVFFSFFAQASFGCEFNLPHQVMVFSNEMSGKSALASKDCEPQAVDDLHQIITELEGRVASFQLVELMNAKGHAVTISPPSIKVQQLRSLLRDQLQLPPGVQVKTTRAVNKPGIMALTAGDKVEVHCGSCLYGMQQTVNVTVEAFDGTKQSFFASADFKKMVKALRLVSPLNSFSSIDQPGIFKEEYVESIPHTDLITEADNLKFYKTNKSLRVGELLKRSDLNAMNLVKAGLKTDVIIENNMIRIKTQGISRGNGTIGEIVEVFHPQKNKKYQGRVVDINKVLVEL